MKAENRWRKWWRSPLHCRWKAKKLLRITPESSSKGQNFPRIGEGEGFEGKEAEEEGGLKRERDGVLVYENWKCVKKKRKGQESWLIRIRAKSPWPLDWRLFTIKGHDCALGLMAEIRGLFKILNQRQRFGEAKTSRTLGKKCLVTRIKCAVTVKTRLLLERHVSHECEETHSKKTCGAVETTHLCNSYSLPHVIPNFIRLALPWVMENILCQWPEVITT